MVSVAAMKTHRAVREAARCHAYLIHRPGVPAAHDADIEALQEWLDLGCLSFRHRASGAAEESRTIGFWGSVSELERHGLTVLSGVMAAPQDGIPDWRWRSSR